MIIDGSDDLKISLKSLDKEYSTVLLYHQHSLQQPTLTFYALVDKQ